MNAPQQECTVLFADVAGSTGLYIRLGDVAAQRIMQAALERLTGPVKLYRGQLIKTIGDEILCTFPTPFDAASAALDMQRNTQPPVTVRIGFHHGGVIRTANDVFGDCVNIASRLTNAARGGQILTSEFTTGKLPRSIGELLRPFDVTTFKGQDQPMRVYELLWDQEREVTQIATRAGTFSGGSDRAYSKLKLSTTSHERLLLPPLADKFSLGRDLTCTLTVNAPLASRVHAELEYQRGKFVLADHSTNGTYVMDGAGREVFLRRESMPLSGSGAISLGCPMNEQKGELVRYFAE